MTELLPDVAVVDRTAGAAGAACSRLLRALGAEVVEARKVSAHRPEIVLADAPAAEFDEYAVRVVLRPMPPSVATPAYGVDALAELAGAHAGLAAVAALRRVRATGGSRTDVQVDELEVAAACAGTLGPRVLCYGRIEPEHSRSMPLVVACRDGLVSITAGTADDKESLRALAGDAPPEQVFAPLSREDAVELGELWRLPILPVLTAPEARHESSGASPLRVEAGRRRLPRGAAGSLASPLADVVVLDLGMMIAGPYCGRILASLGARVVKVEGPTRQDGTRRSVSDRCQGVFADVNRGKQSLVIDLRSDGGRDAFLQLAGRADVVLDNFSPRVMPNFGFQYAALEAVSPGVVTLSMPAFGVGTPWPNAVGYGSGIELAAGLGVPSQAAPVAAVPWTDYLSGCWGAAAAVAALIRRDKHGKGVSIELSQWCVACSTSARAERAAPPMAGADLDALVDHVRRRCDGFIPRRRRGCCRHVARVPLRLSPPSRRNEARAPAFGADSLDVLCRLGGLEAARVAALVAAGQVIDAGFE